MIRRQDYQALALAIVRSDLHTAQPYDETMRSTRVKIDKLRHRIAPTYSLCAVEIFVRVRAST
jgi:hypothetical protein